MRTPQNKLTLPQQLTRLRVSPIQLQYRLKSRRAFFAAFLLEIAEPQIEKKIFVSGFYAERLLVNSYRVAVTTLAGVDDSEISQRSDVSRRRMQNASESRFGGRQIAKRQVL